MGPTPIPEMARAYGLRPRLWLLIQQDLNAKEKEHALFCHVCNRSLCVTSVEAEMVEE